MVVKAKCLGWEGSWLKNLTTICSGCLEKDPEQDFDFSSKLCVFLSEFASDGSWLPYLFNFLFFLWNLLAPLFSLLWKMRSVYLVLCFFRGIAVCSALNTYEQTNLCLEVGALYSINSIPYQANRVSVSVFYLKIDINNAKWIRTIAIITWITT